MLDTYCNTDSHTVLLRVLRRFSTSVPGRLLFTLTYTETYCPAIALAWIFAFNAFRSADAQTGQNAEGSTLSCLPNLLLTFVLDASHQAVLVGLPVSISCEQPIALMPYSQAEESFACDHQK